MSILRSRLENESSSGLNCEEKGSKDACSAGKEACMVLWGLRVGNIGSKSVFYLINVIYFLAMVGHIKLDYISLCKFNLHWKTFLL